MIVSLCILLPGIAHAYSLFDFNSNSINLESNIQHPPASNDRRRQKSNGSNKPFQNIDQGPFSEHSRLPPVESTLSTGLFHTCAITYRAGVDQDTCGENACGPVKCWGHNDRGQSSSPPGVMFQQVSAGGFFTCGLKAGGKVACWGDIDHPPKSLESLSRKEQEDVTHARRMQQMADGHSGKHSRPVNGGDYYIQISSGKSHACAIQRTGEIHCWGRNDYGEGSPPEGKFVQISAGNSFSCGIRPNGSVECWGKNDMGQSSPPSYPENIFEQISASVGGDHACGLTRDGDAVRCWGNNGRGQSENQEDGRFLRVAAGTRTTCAIRANDDSEGSTSTTIHCWGSRGNALLDHFRVDANQANDENNRRLIQTLGLGQDHACASSAKNENESSRPDSSAKSSVECWWMAGSDFAAHRVPVGLEMVE